MNLNRKNIKVDKFVLAIILSIAIAYFFPYIGSKDSPINLDLIGSIGISLIFFFYGLNLNNTEIRNGLANWRLHVVVQACTFVLFPVIIVLFYPFLKGTSYELMWLSFLFMAALPSSVSSSVVMVSLARGNLPAAIFNASISGIIGILITPLWMTAFTKQSGIDYDFTSIYLHLFTEIVLPLALGLLLRKFWGDFARRHTKAQDIFDKFIVLLIIYKSFVHSFEDNIFAGISSRDLLFLFSIVIVLFFFMFYITDWIGKLLKFNRADSITAQFCGTKKSLIHGTVFSEALFGHTSIVGIILLPLMIYHAFQIFVVSIYAGKKGEEYEALQRRKTRR